MTTTAIPMLDTYPKPINLDRTKLATAIEALTALDRVHHAMPPAPITGP